MGSAGGTVVAGADEIFQGDAANDLDQVFLRLVECSESLDAAELDRALAALAALETEAA